MAKITRTNPKNHIKPFSNYAHVVTVEGAKKLVFCAGQGRRRCERQGAAAGRFSRRKPSW